MFCSSFGVWFYYYQLIPTDFCIFAVMPKSTIFFFAADVPIPIKRRILLKDFIQQQITVLRGSNYFCQLNIVFCSDEYLLQINRQYLNHDYYTDIITFPLTDTPKELLAEIYISTDRVKENAQLGENQKLIVSNKSFQLTFISPFSVELHRVLFHGILHLLGYNDKTPKQKAAMRQAENLWLTTYAEYIEGFLIG